MFKCAKCKASVGPKVSPILHVFPREASYTYEDAEGNPQVSLGFETDAEFALCAPCAVEMGDIDEIPTPLKPTEVHSVVLAGGLNSIVSKGSKKTNFDVLAERAKATNSDYVALELQGGRRVVIGTMRAGGSWEQAMAPVFKQSLCAMAVDTLMDRTTHESVRATRDFAAAYPVLKGYEQRGGAS